MRWVTWREFVAQTLPGAQCMGGWGLHAAAGSSWTRAWGNRDMSVGLQGKAAFPRWLSPCPGLWAGLELPVVPCSLGSEGFG